MIVLPIRGDVRIHLGLVLGFFLLLVQSLHAADYSSLAVGALERVKINSLHPTQFRVGQAEVDEKRDEFEKMGPKKLDAYLKAHPCPVVIGPKGIPYVTDEQHRANASYEAESSHRAVRALREGGEPTMYMKVIANYSSMSEADFEKAMIANHYTFLNDLGKPRAFSELPRHVYQMKNDPYRSLAGFVEDTAYQMSGVYFAQFQVADWLREHLGYSDHKVNRELREHRKKILARVTGLLESPAARGESWFKAGACESAFRGVR